MLKNKYRSFVIKKLLFWTSDNFVCFQICAFVLKNICQHFTVQNKSREEAGGFLFNELLKWINVTLPYISVTLSIFARFVNCCHVTSSSWLYKESIHKCIDSFPVGINIHSGQWWVKFKTEKMCTVTDFSEKPFDFQKSPLLLHNLQSAARAASIRHILFSKSITETFKTLKWLPKKEARFRLSSKEFGSCCFNWLSGAQRVLFFSLCSLLYGNVFIEICLLWPHMQPKKVNWQAAVNLSIGLVWSISDLCFFFF